jgi:hypothetical protein
MSKKDNHITQPSKLTRFHSFEEMKSSPFSIRPNKPLDQLKAEYSEAIAQLRSAFSAGKVRRLIKNKNVLK